MRQEVPWQLRKLVSGLQPPQGSIMLIVNTYGGGGPNIRVTPKRQREQLPKVQGLTWCQGALGIPGDAVGRETQALVLGGNLWSIGSLGRCGRRSHGSCGS